MREDEFTTAAVSPRGEGAAEESPAGGAPPQVTARTGEAAVKPAGEAAAARPGDLEKDPASADERFTGEGEKPRFSMPDGFDPDPYAERFGEVAGELGLDAPGSEKLVAFWNEVAGDVAAAREDAWKEARREWATRTLRDREIGGANLDRTILLASRVVNSFGSEELKEVFRSTGLGNHPEVVRFMTRVGKALGEDELHVGSQSPTGGQKSAAELIYGRK